MTEIWVRFVAPDGAPADEPFPVLLHDGARVANLKRSILADSGSALKDVAARDLVLSDGEAATGTLSAATPLNTLSAGTPENPVLVGSGSEPTSGKLAPFGEKKDPVPEGAAHFAWLALAMEIVIVILFATCTDYDAAADAGNDAVDGEMGPRYTLYQDVHVMISIGFGGLYLFLKKNGWGSIGFNFIVAAIAVQVAILTEGFFHLLHEGTLDSDKIKIGIETLILGDFGAAAVLISFGALLGKVNATQLLVLTVVELFAYSANYYFGSLEIQSVDVGGSMFVHAFGCYHGLACAWMLGRKAIGHPNEASNKASDTFAMFGTLFLWVFWPSFVAALTDGSQQQRAVINTLLSMTGSCMGGFALSALMRPHNKFDMVDIQNATLAGGVAIGTSADMMVRPWGAIAIGLAAGMLSVWGYARLQPWLERTIGLHDTCGINNLHGMPGILGAIVGALGAATADTETYGSDISMFPKNSDGTSEGEQAEAQVLALLITIVMAISSGIVSGFILRLPILRSPDKLFDDSIYFHGVDPNHLEAVAQSSSPVPPISTLHASSSPGPQSQRTLLPSLSNANAVVPTNDIESGDAVSGVGEMKDE